MTDTPEQAEARERHHRHIVAPAMIREERARAEAFRDAVRTLCTDLSWEAYDLINGAELIDRLKAAADECDRDADALEESIRQS